MEVLKAELRRQNYWCEEVQDAWQNLINSMYSDFVEDHEMKVYRPHIEVFPRSWEGPNN